MKTNCVDNQTPESWPKPNQETNCTILKSLDNTLVQRYYVRAISEQSFPCQGRVLPSQEGVRPETDRTAPCRFRCTRCTKVLPVSSVAYLERGCLPGHLGADRTQAIHASTFRSLQHPEASDFFSFQTTSKRNIRIKNPCKRVAIRTYGVFLVAFWVYVLGKIT